jgi:hypothetical protein
MGSVLEMCDASLGWCWFAGNGANFRKHKVGDEQRDLAIKCNSHDADDHSTHIIRQVGPSSDQVSQVGVIRHV